MTSGTAGELVVMETYKPEACTGTGRHRSCVFELATFQPFHFAAKVETGNVEYGKVVTGDNPEEIDNFTFTYEPGAEVDIKFDVTSFTSSMRGETGALLSEAQQVSVDPFGTEFKIYIDAPMLVIDDARRNGLSEDKFYYDEEEEKFVYVVDQNRATERGFWTETALVADSRNVDYLGNSLSADKQVGERKVLPFKTNAIVSDGQIVISSEKEKVIFYDKTFNVTNEPIIGEIRYGAVGIAWNNATSVPAGAFVPFEALPTYNRIGSMVIGQNGKYELHLRREYRYNWTTDDVKLQYVETVVENGSSVEKIYEKSYTSLAELYADKNILLTLKQN